MIKQTLAAIFSAAMLMLPTAANAQIVTVNGSGTNEAAAIKDAKRSAVEEVAGTVVKAASKTQNFKLIMDVIETRSQGYVTSFEIINKRKNNGLYEVTAKVDVSAEPNSALMKDIEVVMNLNDPRLSVVTEYYGNDNSENTKQHLTMISAAIRQELINRGFTHVVDNSNDVDYIIFSNLKVNKAQSIKLPNWNHISDDELKIVDTGLSKTTASLECKIKKVDTNEIIGEFSLAANNIGNSNNDIQTVAVNQIAQNAAQQVRLIFNREASKVFKSVKIIASINGSKVAAFEKILRQTDGINNVYMRSLNNGKCTVDVDTDLTPQQLYEMLSNSSKGKLNLNMQSFSSTTLNIIVD